MKMRFHTKSLLFLSFPNQAELHNQLVSSKTSASTSSTADVLLASSSSSSLLELQNARDQISSLQHKLQQHASEVEKARNFSIETNQKLQEVVCIQCNNNPLRVHGSTNYPALFTPPFELVYMC
jgi:hypothetical protein